MSLLNKSTLKQKFQDFINRISPFNGNPLIQKSEHQELVGDDLMDSTIFRAPSVSAISSPSAAFDVDFNNADRFDIDTTGSGGNSFLITLAGLNDNETGILNITKKSADLFTFANGLITPFNNTEGQDGQTNIVLFVKVVAGTYIVQAGYEYNYIVDTPRLSNGAVTNSKLGDFSVSNGKISNSAVTRSKVGYRVGEIIHSQTLTENISSGANFFTRTINIDRPFTGSYSVLINADKIQDINFTVGSKTPFSFSLGMSVTPATLQDGITNYLITVISLQ